MPELKIEYCSPDELSGNPRNARTHSPQQIAKLAQSIRKFGFNVPILIDCGNAVVAGHGRLEAARQAGLKKVPTILLEHLTEEQKRAFMIADNRLAELARWDRSTLAIELHELTTLDLDFEITDTGFEVGEIDVLLNEQSDASAENEADAIDDILQPGGLEVAEVGDLWLLGSHTLYCGDALSQASC